MSKYFAGSIYMITYLDGIAGLISTILGDQMYSRLRVKISFIFSVSLTLFGASFIFLFEQDYLTPYFIDDCGANSPYKNNEQLDHSEKDKQWHLSKIIPVFSFITKFGLNLSFLNAYICSYNDDEIFPVIKRATAIGICNFIARTLTILAPIVAELDRPIPILTLFFV